jgi:hypothetical protein
MMTDVMIMVIGVIVVNVVVLLLLLCCVAVVVKFLHCVPANTWSCAHLL